MVTEPRGALTCRSLTLAVLADSGPFRGLLLTVWGPITTFMVAEPQGALSYRSSTLTVLTILARFMGYYSPFWGKEQFPWLPNPEVRLRAGH